MALPGLLPGRGQQGPARLPGAVGAGDGAGSGAVCLKATLQFFDQGHKYTLDGEELPSVTTITRFLSYDYKSDSPWLAQAAARRGSDVHAACAMLDYGEEPETDPEISGYLKAYLRFLMDYQPDWEGIETPLYDPGMLFAGTPDRWGHINGRRVLVDIKTGVVHRHAVSAQLAGYELLIGGFAPEETYALRLDKSGVYELIPIRADADLFLWCFNIHRALKRRI